MANNANEGFEHRYAFAASPGTFTGGGGKRFEVVRSTIKKQGEILESQGVTGTRKRFESRSRPGIVRIGGDLDLQPSFNMLDFFLPFVLGATESTDTFNVADALTGFDMQDDPFGTGTAAELFSELYVNRATLRFAPGLLEWTLNCHGKTITLGQTFTSAALSDTAAIDEPLAFQDSASGFNIQSGAIEIIEGELTIDNFLDPKFRNSPTALAIRAQDRVVGLRTNIPLTPTTWGTYFGDKSAVDATITLTRGSVSSVITLYNLKAPDDGPEMGGKSEVPLVLNSTARGDSSDPDIRWTVTGGSL